MKALADRRSDLPVMAEAMLPTLAERLKIARLRFAEAAVECLSALHWDGNLIEMESVLAAAVLGTPANQRISADFLRKTHAGFSSSLDPEKMGFENWVDQILQSGSLQIADLEARIYRAAVTHAEGNLSAAARLLGLTRAQLAYRLDRDRTATLPITE